MRSPKWLPVYVAVVVAGAGSAIVACAAGGKSDEGSLVGGGEDSGLTLGGDSSIAPQDDGGGLGNIDAATKPPEDFGAEAFWADDPPPAMCGDSGVVPKVPGGTPECPDDKNREGCPCSKEGEKAACWPGLRKNRNRGICKDGETTCVRKKESTMAWGPCEGYSLPTPGGTGKEACVCFSGGRWELLNLSPCFYSMGGSVVGAVSTLPNYGSDGKAKPACPPTFETPTTPWTKTTLKIDCAGHFKLCYTLKAGDSKAPKPTDCVLTKQCAEGDYVTPNVVQPWGDLPAWKSTNAACAAQFEKSGGYGEMSVEGTSIECDAVNKIFLTVGYCSTACATNPTAPGCEGCASGGGGSF